MRHTFALCLLLAAGGSVRAEDYPHVYLKNEKLRVKVHMPDAEKGFYRGTRFDWAGVLGEVEFAGHKIFGPWKDTHDPTNHDDIIGPCEEFGMESPLGYAEAKPGETFLKIGVGELEKPKEERYSFAKKYRIVKPAAWKETRRNPEGKTEPLEIVWEMESAPVSGYGYRYRKTVRLDPNAAILQIHHLLQTTGTKPITTDFYNHNFFNVDGDPIGPNYRFKFGFDVRAKDLRGRFRELVALDGKELRFKDKLTDGFVMAGLEGFDPTVGPGEHDRFEVRHLPSRVKVVFRHYQVAKFNLWGVKTTICPEPFRQIDNLRGTTLWSVSYEFEHDPPEK